MTDECCSVLFCCKQMSIFYHNGNINETCKQLNVNKLMPDNTKKSFTDGSGSKCNLVICIFLIEGGWFWWFSTIVSVEVKLHVTNLCLSFTYFWLFPTMASWLQSDVWLTDQTCGYCEWLTDVTDGCTSLKLDNYD